MLQLLCNFLLRLFFFTGSVRDEGSYPRPLSPKEEAKCLALARKGDAAARDKLIRHNMRLVAHIVKKYAGAAETDDMISVGSIGLIKAINTYEPSRGTRLATYTARCIENEVLMFIRAGKKHRANVSLSDPVGTDKDGNVLFSHTYHYIGMEPVRGLYEFESDDADSGEFTYFFLAPDTSAETYHIEFRYGSDAEALSQYDAGEYAYWVASGISTDCDQTMIDNCIELFCTENLAG